MDFADLDDTEALLREYDDNLIHKATPDNMLCLIDASSLLWRLEVMSTSHIKYHVCILLPQAVRIL